MARFEKGDKVTDGNAVYEITDVDDGIYEWKFVSGKADPSHSKGGEIAWVDNRMTIANTRTANAKFKEGDRVKIVGGGSLSGKTGRVARISSDSIGVYADVVMDGNGREEQVPIDILHIANSAPLASANAVVQNAINARRARNAKAEFVQPYVSGDVSDNGCSIRLIKLQDEIKDATADGCAAKAFQQIKLLREVANSLEKVAKWMGSLA